MAIINFPQNCCRCSLDRFLLKDLDYGNGLMAGQKSQVFKFADKPTIFFSCMIRLEFKEKSSDECAHPSQHCPDQRQDPLSIQTPDRVVTSISNDFPRPPTNMSHRQISFESLVYNE
ncbi:hypothetical protein COOONC_09911 [Cooperia oncophora]